MEHISYTARIGDAIWCIDYNSEYDYSEIIDYLNSENFRTFGDGLSAVILPKANSGESAIDCLKRRCKEKEIDMTNELASVNTIKSWFSGGERPKKGEESRRKMFLIAFALALTVEETKYLMQKVFLDRAFNPRNPKELVYYYCIENGYSLKRANEMISKINIDNTETEDKTVFTEMLASITERVKKDDELIDYINSHPHNFSINNVAAKKAVAEYITKAKSCVAKEIESPAYEAGEDKNGKTYHIKDGKNTDSINFMYEIITGQSVTGEKGTKSIFKNAELPKEIKVNFPEAATFSKKEPSYDELRKMLIVLFSYWFWYNMPSENEDGDLFDDYIAQLNDLLFRTGLPEIYPGNPFDWMFCFCTTEHNPLDTFRTIIAEALEMVD